jgi:hypothetical protein
MNEAKVKGKSEDKQEVSQTTEQAKPAQTASEQDGQGKGRAGKRMDLGEMTEIDGRMIPESFRVPYETGMIRSVSETIIEYTDLFYERMLELTQGGAMKGPQAYESLGFNLSITGVNRASQALKNAKMRKKAAQKSGAHPYDYNGSVKLTEEELNRLTDDQCIAYLRARILYLEEVTRAQKKTFMMLEDISSL